jgi:transposase-like protein
MGSKGKRYSNEFKDEIIRTIKENGRSVSSVCKDVGLTEQTVYRWLNEANQPEPSDDKKRIAELEEQLKQEKRRVADLEDSVNILKKATAIFANQQHRK